ncbi:MAG: response regulator transcription factor [Phenylobacterium sp.]|uniref:response regulator transcription factor n=1 Tax=Phenylobacterium sp. TaxID=1871053 RepID=UPI00391C41C8
MLQPYTPRPTVVLVDDDAALRTALTFSLELDGYQVEACESGEELLRTILPITDACLVLDYNLDGMNGLAALAELRGRGVNLPALLITSHPRPAVRQAAADMRAKIVEKPLLGDALIAEIRAALDPHPA